MIGFQKFPIVDVVMLVVYGKSSIGVNVGDRWLKKFLMVEKCIYLYCHVWERMLELQDLRKS